MFTSSTLDATCGEVYVTITYGWKTFPAIIDHERSNGFPVPRFRRTVAEAIAPWLNSLHGRDPSAWRHTATIDGDVFSLTDTEQGTLELIEPDENNRYAIGSGVGPWELTAPQRDSQADAALLSDPARLTAEDGEILVTVNIDGEDPAFPALSWQGGWSRAGSPRFRRPVAEAVVAWISNTASMYGPDECFSAYWDGDIVVLIDPQLVGEDGYLPSRIAADEDGRYSIGATFEWERVD
ncbi:hypothetical protein [Amycolatopsis saalfeldensis]|uniref:Uncharacterized protein n=1 Tax=Amycolatopsis saalfeldensis TaxID=394193 RepID=A0A1H8YNS9_9PSEU|nr:hypothetical protein [Amycolatopsis saalfeldensis]SEP53806.1 hypothetical protein SAMN04489732_13145 [Amycolatopsis saalfeldensis]